MIDSLIRSLKTQLAILEDNIHQEKSPCSYVTLEVPMEQPAPLSAIAINDSFFLAKPDSNFTMLGLGSLLSVTAKGKKRCALIKAEFSQILKLWYRDKESNSDSPLAFFAFAFNENDPMDDKWDHFPNTLLTIPIVLIKQSHSCQTLVVNIKLNQTDYDLAFATIEDLLKQFFNHCEKQSTHTEATSPDNIKTSDSQSKSEKKIWQTLAEKAISEIHAGHFDKLVTSRQQSLQTERPISVPHLIQKLIAHYPSCTIFSYCSPDRKSSKQSSNNPNNQPKNHAGKTIIAASPERLVTLQHPDIQSDALGGTIFPTGQQKEQALNHYSVPLPFFLKQFPEQTEAESSESKKLLKEHHFISQSIYQSLDPLCHTLKMPMSPFLMKLHNLYHLETPIQGKLMDDFDLFDAIKALHPTPAVAGLPTRQAKQWLLENENYHRGWYTGAFGWLDGNKNGDLSVLLRCALIQSNSTHSKLDLFAGAGLVSESTPDAEWQETELKIQTIVEML